MRVYLDLLHSLHDNGLRHVFLVSGHLGGRHLKAVARIAEEASRQIDGMKVYALIDSERAERLKLEPSATLVPIERGLNFPMLTELLGRGTEVAASTHADGWEEKYPAGKRLKSLGGEKPCVNLVRYAGDFVITSKSKELLEDDHVTHF